MATIKSWIDAARPRTLPLALSGIIMGSGLAWYYAPPQFIIFILAVITATLIQIFSNFANDYGDSIRGTDNRNRVGPTRTVQSGKITKREMHVGMSVIGSLSFISGLILVWIGCWSRSKPLFFLFIAMGIASHLAAYFYTAGKKSYGYIGMGDLSVFIFFGLIPVIGVFYLNSGLFRSEILLPAVTIGLFSTGVLNLNNMRDAKNDRQSGKITVAALLGFQYAKIYHTLLITGGLISSIIFITIKFHSLSQLLPLLIFPVFISDLIKIHKIHEEKNFDPFLRKLSISTLIFTALFVTGLLI